MPGDVVQSYVERPAPPALVGLVASVWVQRVDGGSFVHRDLPTGCVELRCRLGRVPEVVGPLTRARVELLDPGATVVGVRLRPEAAARVLSRPGTEVVDEVVSAEELWGDRALRLAEAAAAAPTAAAAAGHVLRHIGAVSTAVSADPVVGRAVRALQWSIGDVRAVARGTHVSERQLRRRVLAEVGLSPKILHRTLRFQRFLALAQHAMAQGRPPGDGGLARLAVDSGFADQAHLSRECARLIGSTPAAFLRGIETSCGCRHDHTVAFAPLLRAHDGERRDA